MSEKSSELFNRPSVDDLPVSQSAFEDYIMYGQRLATDLASDIAQEIQQMKGRDKVNCWARFTEVFFTTMPKGMMRSTTASDAQKSSIRRMLAEDCDDVDSEPVEEQGK